MAKLTKIMIEIWKMQNIDWMGYFVDDPRKFTYHHIEKKENNGKTTIDNGAILGTSHPYLHLIESKDLELYVYLNNILKNINSQRQMPTKQQLLAIDSCLRQFEREYSGKVTQKGKILIKEEYTRRIIK